jgi:2-polyprenyl-3-methyl-5-hydroxy-6-metoxy-1,4-benzoquinol methylase
MQGWKTPMMGQQNPHQLKKIRPNIEDLKSVLLPEDELVDVGCYQGHLYRELKHQKYTGIDLFEDNLNVARFEHPGASFLAGDLFSLEGLWDVVFCCRVLVHIPDFDKAVERLRSCARKHCAIVIPMGEDKTEKERIKGQTVYFRTFSEETVKSAGACEIRHHQPYSTVIYGPRLP